MKRLFEEEMARGLNDSDLNSAARRRKFHFLRESMHPDKWEWGPDFRRKVCEPVTWWLNEQTEAYGADGDSAGSHVA